MNRGGSFGGGQSSLNYLFTSDEEKRAAPASRTLPLPPYGIDMPQEKKPSEKSPHLPTSADHEKQNVSNNYHRADGQNSGNFITGRPSTKVQSAPGGQSSLGYLFGEK
ncbi:protein SPIRAL1-like 5 [Impatiens glandulifera]|uniref:protein SPIRAL1-like 5 n=1 Tax=Impatiens glandulifera TaxID=253017 RepID=UPI001FB0E35A|nr:protein SPIRAL1-like 5 [Impatiens glandulifera]